MLQKQVIIYAFLFIFVAALVYYNPYKKRIRDGRNAWVTGVFGLDKAEKFEGQSDNMHALDLENISIFLINMTKNPDRYRRFVDSFKNTDLTDAGFTRIEGVNGKAIDVRKYVSEKAYKGIRESEKQGFRKHHYQLTRGAVGCYLSHLNVYKEIVKQKKPYGLIFEDDVRILKNNILYDINKVIDTVPKDWDILLLGCVCFVCGKYASYYDVNRYFLMHGYLIKRKSAEKVLHMLENEPIEQQIDAKFSDLAERGLIKIYCLRNKLAVQWDMGTNIQIPVKTIAGINPYDAMLSTHS